MSSELERTGPTPPRDPGRPVPHRRRSAPLVTGILLAVVGLPLLLGGLGLGWAVATQRDGDGFFSTPTEQLTSDTPALSTGAVTIGEAGSVEWWTDRDLADVRLSARTTDASAVFIRIAPSADVERYLDNASYDEISDLLDDPVASSLTRRGAGGDLGAAPGDQGFWTARSSGTGTQTLTWDLRPGTWTAVVMNLDGSAGLEVDVALAGRLDWLGPLAVGLGLIGAALLLVGTLLVVHGARPAPWDHARDPAPSEPDAVPDTPVTLVGAQDPTLSRWLWLVKWFLAIPHLIVLAVLWLVFVVLTVVAFLAIVVSGRYPRGLFDLNVGILRWTWRVQFYATGAIGTDRYPPFTLDHRDYPADLDIAYPQRLSRRLVLVKSWLLALPHLIVMCVLAGTWQLGDTDGFGLGVGGLIGALTLAAGLLLLFTGRYPASLFDLLVGLNRWVYRVVAYVALMTDTYPPFRLDQGPAEPGGR